MIAISRWTGCTAFASCAPRGLLFRRHAVCDHTRYRRLCSPGAWQLPALLDRAWLLKAPDTQIREVTLETGPLVVIQDDLLHPILGGNKLRKLDALLPEVKAAGCTDLLTCGGVQSAHTAAVAAACAEQGIRAHLLVRGERPAVPTGFHLLACMYGEVTYVPRTEYADRDAMMTKYAQLASVRAGKLHVLPEGGAEPAALLGCIRLIHWLSQPHALGPKPLTLVVDCGTGTTATGLRFLQPSSLHDVQDAHCRASLGGVSGRTTVASTGVILAGPPSYYQDQQSMLTASFTAKYMPDTEIMRDELPLDWVERPRPRRFGKVFREDVVACQQVARQHGILVDPIYSLSAWQVATNMCQLHPKQGRCRTAMLHTGGALGLQGIAQRHPDWF